MLGIYAHGLRGLCVSEPSELHDRAAGRVQDQLLDLFDVTVDAVELAAEQGDLGDRRHQAAMGTPARVNRLGTGARLLP